MDRDITLQPLPEVTPTDRAKEQKTPDPTSLELVREFSTVATALLKAFFLLLIMVFLLFNLDMLKSLVHGVRHVELMGVKLDIDSTAKIFADDKSGGHAPPSLGQAEGALRRASKSADLFARATILWVDDYPENNLYLRRVLHDLGASVVITLSTNEAADSLRRHFFDVVISDINRPEGTDVTKNFAQLVAKERPDPPYFIFYVGKLDSRDPPKGAFAITNRSDDLLNLVTDALERRYRTR